MRELMKSMREATQKSGMLDNPGSDLGTDLLDQQFAVQMSGQPGGLSEMIEAQLKRQMGMDKGPVDTGATQTEATGTVSAAPAKASAPSATATLSTASPARAVSKVARPPTTSQVDFVRKHSDVEQGRKIQQHSGQLHAGPGRP